MSWQLQRPGNTHIFSQTFSFRLQILRVLPILQRIWWRNQIILTGSKCLSLFYDTGSLYKNLQPRKKRSSEPLLLQFAASFQFCQVACTVWSLLALAFFFFFFFRGFFILQAKQEFHIHIYSLFYYNFHHYQPSQGNHSLQSWVSLKVDFTQFP